MKRYALALLGIAALASGPDAFAEEVKLTQGGLTLNANLERSAAWPRGPVVLLTHGTLAHRGMEIISGLQSMLSDRDVSSLAINLSLGLNDRAAAMYDCPTPHTHKHTDAVGEIGAWVAWLKGQGVDRIALLGHSRGGNQVARYAAATPDSAVGYVVLLAPQTREEGSAAADYEKRFQTPLRPVLERAQGLMAAGKGGELLGPIGFLYCEGTRARAESLVSYYAPDPDMDTPRLLPRVAVPVVVFAATEDTAVPDVVARVEPLADGKKVRLVVVDGADHFFRDLYSEEVADDLVDLLGE